MVHLIGMFEKYNLVNMTLVYTTPSILRHIFARPNFSVQNSFFYTTTTLDDETLKSPFSHIKEVVNVDFFSIYVMYSLKHIHFHLGTTWELHLSLGTQ